MIKPIDRRGVVFTMDMIAALFFFLVILLSFLWLWGETYRHMNEYRQERSRQTKLMDISSMLIRTTGNPPDWEHRKVRADSVRSIGLATEDNVLSDRKLSAFTSADYQTLREILGLGAEDFSLVVSSNYSGSPVVEYSIGTEINSKTKSVIRRYALLNGTIVELRLTGYYNMTQ